MDITFHHPLRYQEYFDCLTVFHYARPPSTEFRRATHRRVEHLDMRVEFHPESGHGSSGEAVGGYREPAQAIVGRTSWPWTEHSAHRYRSVRQTVVGFYWEW